VDWDTLQLQQEALAIQPPTVPGQSSSGAHHAVTGDHDGQGVPAVTEPVLPLPDVPLIIEDLLLQAQQLADAGAPCETIDEILDQVAALRDGRG